MNNIINQRNLFRCLGCITVILFICAIIYIPSLSSLAQSGVLIPSSIKNVPDPSILSLQVMEVEIKIDNQHAWVKVLQIFDNRTGQVLEGKFLFALPPQSSIADFAVWDGDLRLPGVILEKRRANRLYTQIKEQPVDPGLLQQDDEHGGSSAFSAKVFPIPAYGTKRVELEYTEMLPVDNLTSRFSFPLGPSFGSPQHVGELQLHVKVLSDSPISPLSFRSPAYQLRAVKTGANEQEYIFQGRNIELKDDLDFDYTIDVPKSALSWSAHRAPERISAYDLRDPALAASNPDGYFEARAIFNEQPAGRDKARRSVLLLLDTSLSMHGEKLVQSVEAVDFFLHSLGERDQFNLALFNRDFSSFSPTPLPVTTDNVERALGFVKSSMLSGGTDLNQALLNAVELINKFPAGERSVVLISDANPTLKTVDVKRIVRSFDAANDSEKSPKARLFALAIGTDANRTLLEELTRKCRGYFLQARETQDISTQLKIIFLRIGMGSIDGLQLITSDPKNFSHIYPAQMLHSFDQSSFAFVGRYKKPARGVEVKVQGKSGAEPVGLSRRVQLPELETAHEHLPRLWARARVDALLYEMNLNGEREDYIAEIIRLSQKYKFVTPYTAFLAAPRSLLRPRVIQPGDPVIRVKTDPSINSVFAVLPFGDTLPLRFITTDGLWETRFLAPAWMPDGTYKCRLLMTDEKGNGYQEEKSFVIDSHPPRLSAILPNQTIRAGEELIVKVSADRDTMRLIAKFYGAQPAQLAWSDREKTNIGRLRIPAGLASGQYRLTVSAEDFAHNQSSVEVPVTVIGR
ncbi:MAG: VIT and VWA domain-containing protein [Acidobacteria bacterium]|nr:VIT and VWA domain-containing protein [Acidobacteriota bacterium]